MLTRIRQVAIMVRDLDQGLGHFTSLLGLEATSYGDLTQYGLKNAIVPAGQGTVLEFLTPTDPQSAGARFMERRGEGLYLLIFEVEDKDAVVARLRDQGVQVTQETETMASFHPRSLNGVFVQITQPGGSGAEAEATRRQPPEGSLVQRVRQVVFLVRDLDQVVARWEALFDLNTTNRFHVSHGDLNAAILPLGQSGTFIEIAEPASPDASAARYLETNGEGMYLLIFQTPDLDVAEAALRHRGGTITQVVPPGGAFRSLWLHPRAMHGVFTQLSQVNHPENPWPPAGDRWYKD